MGIKYFKILLYGHFWRVFLHRYLQIVRLHLDSTFGPQKIWHQTRPLRIFGNTEYLNTQDMRLAGYRYRYFCNTATA